MATPIQVGSQDRAPQEPPAAERFAATSLLDAQEFAQSLIRTTDVLVISMGLDGTVQSVNESVQRVTGYSADELEGKTWQAVTELIAPREVYPELWDEIAAIDIHSMPVSVIEPIVTKSGEQKHISWRINVVEDRGAVVGTICLGLDITERKRAEAALVESERRFRSLVKNSTDMIGILDLDLVILWQSPASEALIGYRPEELVGRSVAEFLPDEDLPGLAELIAQLLAAPGQPQTIAYQFRHKDGGFRHLEGRATNLLDDPAIKGIVVNSRDVTERVEAEEALRASEERFRALVQNSSDILIVLEADGSTSYVSPSCEAVLGYRPDELLGSKPFEYMHPEDVQRAVEVLAGALQNPQEKRTIEVRLRHKNGSWRHVEAIGTNLLDDSPVRGIVLNTRDVTEREQAAEALRRSEQRFRDLFENANDMVYTRDLAGTLTAVNRMGERLTGYARDELIGRNISQLMPAADVERSMMTLENAPGPDEDDVTDIVEFIRKDGRRVPVEVRARLIYEGDTPVAVQGIARDISERLKAQAELRASEERFRELFENANDLLYIHDLNGRFLAVNKKALQVTGYTEEEALSRNLADILPPGELERAATMLAEGIPTYELNVIAKDGTLVPLEVSTRLVYRDGRAWAIQGIARDITDRRQAEAAKLERSRLDSLSAEMGTAFSELPGLEALAPSVEAILREMNLAVVQVWLYEADSDEMRLTARAGLKGRDRIGRHLPARAFPNEFDRQPSDFISNQAEDDPVLQVLAPRGLSRFCAYATYPLIVESEVLGVLTVFNREPIRDGPAQTLSRVSDLLATRLARRRAEEELERTERRFGSLVENTSDIIAIISANGVISYISPSVERVYGFSPDEIIGRNIGEAMTKEEAARALKVLAQLSANPGASGSLDWTLRHKNGSIRHIEAVARNLLDDPSICGIVINARDITERKEFEEELAHQAFYEPLTGLPNRALFMDRLEHALAAAPRGNDLLAVLFLDVDRFKVVNDSLGHSVGDQLLVALGERLAGSLRPGDTLARFGGDEFTVLLERLKSRHDALAVAQRIIEDLATPFRLHGHEMFASASIGIAFGSGGEKAEELLRDADVALYRAKAEGRARYVVFDEEMNLRAIERLDLENDLRRAIERSEIRVQYQSEVELATGRVTGFEALARWKHPRLGDVPPAEFIPLAEDNGLIFPLGLWILREACTQAAKWHSAAPGRRHQVSVNLSARQLQHPELVNQVRAVLAETGLPSDLLTLEITESVALQELPVITERLAELKTLGVRLAIDDFGAGYSSLTYLTRLTVDTLKIDQTFVSGVNEDAGKEAIVRALISLGRSLGLSVTAEGIETEGQLALLKEMQCDRGQGYYFSRPMSRSRAFQLARSGRPRRVPGRTQAAA